MVDFVGAGPGAEDLITVRGMKLIENADQIIYAGSLVNKELLKYAKKDCKVYNSAYMTLEEVIKAIKAAEKTNKNTVRLHTGDPSIYGAIKEQMALLEKENIKYRVCPGVSSFCAAAASLNLEYTLPDVSQTVIITRTEGRTKMPEKEDISLLAKHNCTMVVFLSAGLLGVLTEKLKKGGVSGDTPAAIVYKASWPDEKKCICTVDELEKTAEKENIKNTALIIIGRVLNSEFERSKLYDPSFSTMFRNESDSK
ncbi:MAG: precorrin-4 C(11)-methyltransferase [Clostridia bacterium]|jgi:precorrin-4/cobalt-precorrin-4 C11-methyltransferase|nr:precorrin-4 C(11)-methyltransferase [Clostridia bacterium]